MDKSLRPNGLTVYAIFFLIFLYGPVLLLPLFSVNNSIYITFPLKGFTSQIELFAVPPKAA